MYYLTEIKESLRAIQDELEADNLGNVRRKLQGLMNILESLPLEGIAITEKGKQMQELYNGKYGDKSTGRDE